MAGHIYDREWATLAKKAYFFDAEHRNVNDGVPGLCLDCGSTDHEDCIKEHGISCSACQGPHRKKKSVKFPNIQVHSFTALFLYPFHSFLFYSRAKRSCNTSVIAVANHLFALYAPVLKAGAPLPKFPSRCDTTSG